MRHQRIDVHIRERQHVRADAERRAVCHEQRLHQRIGVIEAVIAQAQLALVAGQVIRGGDAPVDIRQAQQLRNPRVAAIHQPRRHAGLVPALHVRLRLFQLFLDACEIGARGCAVRLRIEARQDAHADRRHLVERDQSIEHHAVLCRHGRHTVVGEHNQVDVIEQAALAQSLHQPRHRRVGLAQRVIHLGRVRPVGVARMVDRIEIQGEKCGPLFGWQIQPRQHLIHALIRCHLGVEKFPLVRVMTADSRLRTGPEHRGRAQAVQPRGFPQRHAGGPPAAIGNGLAVAQRELAQLRIDHRVVDDAVVIRAQAGDDRVVVRKRQRRERRLHRCGLHAVLRQHRQGRAESAFDVIVAIAVDRDQQQRQRVRGSNRSNRGDRRSSWWWRGAAEAECCHRTQQQAKQ